MSENKVVYRGGTNVLGLLGVVFVTLKLLGITAVAGWSWWLVTAPFWGGLAVVLVVLLVMVLLAGVVAIADHCSK